MHGHSGSRRCTAGEDACATWFVLVVAGVTQTLRPTPPPFPGGAAKLALGATIGTSSASAATVLKTFKLIIVGSICGTQSNTS